VSWGRRREPLFDRPGRASGWGIVGCLLCYVFARFGIGWTLVITVVTAFIGCWNL